MSELDIEVGDGAHEGYVRVWMGDEWRWMPPLSSNEIEAVEAARESATHYCECQGTSQACSYCGCCEHSYYTDWECEVEEEFPEGRRCEGLRPGDAGYYPCYCEGADDFWPPKTSRYQRMLKDGKPAPLKINEAFYAQ